LLVQSGKFDHWTSRALSKPQASAPTNPNPSLARTVIDESAMSLLDGVSELRAGLDYHLARQNLLTANLAHVDTPGFQPLDLVRTDTQFGAVMHAELSRTEPGHLGAAATGSAASYHVQADPDVAASMDGNGVSIDREAVKIAANNIRYDTLSTLVTSELSGLEWAANDGR
jgi:flagellar basal-body rod protein FlgB